MRQLRFTPEAEQTLAAQISYLIDQGAVGAAETLKTRVESFLATTLAEYPRNGRLIAQRQIWETWIPRTRLVVWYTFTDDVLVVITFWHTSQDRQHV
jgi:plasmid stabilization system protein ParE